MKWLNLRRKPTPEAPQASFTACPRCGKEMRYVEKYTMGGEDLRTYRCDPCQEEFTLNFGTAMWKLMSDANKTDHSALHNMLSRAIRRLLRAWT
jgi:transposase-like protein